MKVNNFFLWLCFCVSLPLIAQNDLVIKGKVIHNNQPLPGVHIQNIDKKKFVTTDTEGLFLIHGEVGNVLKFTHVGKKDLYRSVNKEDLENELLIIELKEQVVELEEVEVKETTVTAKDFLGYTPKKRTLEEKRSYANNNFWAGSGFPPINILAILNAISGKRKYYKQALKNETNLAVANYIIDNMNRFLKKDLGLDDEKISVLAYYVMENPDIHNLVKSKNDKQLEFMLTDIWVTDLSEKLKNKGK
ncbi:carboxypeptidase-like regulatory domain-containing protein [Capnocytophaga canis]|uniref:carboxypeptidase-like regulatory domain-containing protein n=1 Tax=Capnocytophaga canis TaxID=1848903 RepID=UPI00385EE622